MKVLYLVNACDNKYVNFQAAQVTEENEREFIVIDKINIDGYVYNFPKDKINVELDMGFVTDKLDKKALKVQIERIYNKLRDIHTKNNDSRSSRVNEDYYNGSIEDLNRCVTPEEYKAKGLKEKEDKELEERLRVFFI